ncbi:MAG: TonB-dependent copper receptor [Pseudomonadota bacterium]
MRLKPLAVLLGCAPLFAHAADTPTLDEIVVTAPRMLEPLTVELDPKAPQQPVPANDGASFLKNVPGFNVIRKGGTDGDPVLRGLAGSRLNVLLDGADFHGGCGMRMDPPTAYVFPETFDKVTVIKGPQTVAYGNGNAAGVVLFERDRGEIQPGASASLSALAGAWERVDLLASGKAASDKAHIEATLTHAESGNYEDGNGTEVHSAYQRQSGTVLAGFRPDRDTRIDFDYTASKAEAAYADRSMDGVKFDRDTYGLTVEKKAISPLLAGVSLRLYHSYIDHVMDNYSLRPNPGTPVSYSVSNPDRETDGARASADLALGESTTLKLGADWRDDQHTLRQRMMTSLALAEAYAGLPRLKDYESSIVGVFGELTHHLGDGRRVIGGLRHDNWDATRYNAGVFLADAERDLTSGFARYEQDLAGMPATAFVGLGHNERPMDYWEAVNKGGLSLTSNLNPEKTHQLDAGLLWKSQALQGSVSLFYAKVDDYLLTRINGVAGCASAMGCVENVDATRFGGEADLAWRFAPAWTLRGTLAYVHADNDTRDVPLAQTPPLEGRLGLDYTTGPWTFGGVLRMVAAQDRVDVGYGNIVGQDIGTTPGFATLALNTSYKPSKKLLISAGIDNLFDKAYAEHISRAGALVSGYTQTTRVNEPGRFIWAKIAYHFD